MFASLLVDWLIRGCDCLGFLVLGNTYQCTLYYTYNFTYIYIYYFRRVLATQDLRSIG